MYVFLQSNLINRGHHHTMIHDPREISNLHLPPFTMTTTMRDTTPKQLEWESFNLQPTTLTTTVGEFGAISRQYPSVEDFVGGRES